MTVSFPAAARRSPDGVRDRRRALSARRCEACGPPPRSRPRSGSRSRSSPHRLRPRGCRDRRPGCREPLGRGRSGRQRRGQHDGRLRRGRRLQHRRRRAASGTMTIALSRSPLATSAEVTSWLDAQTVADTTVASVPVTAVVARGTATATAAVDLGALGALAPGVYPLSAAYSSPTTGTAARRAQRADRARCRVRRERCRRRRADHRSADHHRPAQRGRPESAHRRRRSPAHATERRDRYAGDPRRRPCDPRGHPRPGLVRTGIGAAMARRPAGSAQLPLRSAVR
jgi:hypothetical protein